MGYPGAKEISLGGVRYPIDMSTYVEEGPANRVLDRQMYQAATGELDFCNSWPYHQRSWLLGEQQFFTHEFDEMKTTATRRYQEGHGLDASVEGQLGLLKAISRSLTLTTNPTTCPMIASKDGASVYAFPAGETKMYKYTGTAWDAGEAITSVVAPVLDAYMGGDGVIYIIDSNTAGSRVMKRTTGGTWSRVTPATSTLTDGNTEVYSTPVEIAADTKYLTRMPVTYNESFTVMKLHMDGAGSGTGDQVVKAVIYSDVAGAPSASLGTSAEVTITDGQAEGDVAFTFSSVSLTAGYAWVGLIGGTNTLTARWYSTQAIGQYSCYNTDVYVGGAEATFSTGTFEAKLYSAYITATYTVGQWASTAYDTATAVVWINGEVYIITPSAVYDHTLGTICSEFCGGSIACTHDGALYWSDGSNKVYEYNGVGAREVVGQLPPGFAVQCLFSAHARMWICGKLSNGDAAAYWFGQGQYGILAAFPAATSSTRNIYACAATDQYVLFSDSRYGGCTRHYAPEGGWAHHLATGTDTAIPYKGMVTGAGKTFIALATASAGTQGIYCEGTAYVASGVLTSSQADLQMPAHTKRWNEIIVNFLPIRAGESIAVEVSADGGRTWTSAGTAASTVGQTTISYALDYSSATLQYRVTLTAGTSQATDPRILAVIVRGLPKVPNGRQWSFTTKGNPAGPVGGRLITDADAGIAALCTTINDSTVLDFIDPWGGTARVTAQYKRTLAYDVQPPGSRLAVILKEQKV